MARVTELFKFNYNKLLKRMNFLMLIDSLFMATRPVVKCRISRGGGGPNGVSGLKDFLSSPAPLLTFRGKEGLT